MEKKALIFDIEKFAVHDGPGIRTVVFLKGCPLRCLWCHNPESHAMKEELFFRSEKCISCQACASVCPDSCHLFRDGKHLYLREKCSVCGRCTEVCPGEALQKAGEMMSVNEVMEKVLEDQIFYHYSGGGMTLSGGEPLFQTDFTCALLQQAKKHGIHTCVETSGYASGEVLEQTAAFVDLFLWDVKADSFSHRQFTGVEDSLILQNLQRISRIGAQFHLRCPVIPGLNDTEAFFRKIATLSVTYPNCRKIELEPYHPLGEEKSRHLGRTPQYCGSFAGKETLQEQLRLLQSLTDTEIIVHGN